MDNTSCIHSRERQGEMPCLLIEITENEKAVNTETQKIKDYEKSNKHISNWFCFHFL
jgi:hypothetical protein